MCRLSGWLGLSSFYKPRECLRKSHTHAHADLCLRLAPTLAQRLVLNLRSLDDKINGSGTIASQPLPPIDFAHGTVIGNIGAPLRVDDYDDDDDQHGDDIKEVARDSEDLHGIQMVSLDDKEHPNPQEDNIGFVI
jgi:hypothetical protein